jgi:hypothetical protein
VPPRRPPASPPPGVKLFTPDEIELGITKLKRRIEEMKVLEPQRLSYKDQQVRNVEHAIDTTVLDVFGPNSPEYRRHQHHRIWHGGMFVSMPEDESRRRFADGIPQTITI